MVQNRAQNGAKSEEKSEAWERGRALRRELMGERLVDSMASSVYDDPLMQKFGDFSTEAVFGLLWSRPGLDLKTKALICVISDVATGALPELKIHLRMARRQGWTEDELAEAMLHLSGYVGLPKVRGAMITAKELFAEMRTEGE